MIYSLIDLREGEIKLARTRQATPDHHRWLQKGFHVRHLTTLLPHPADPRIVCEFSFGVRVGELRKRRDPAQFADIDLIDFRAEIGPMYQALWQTESSLGRARYNLWNIATRMPPEGLALAEMLPRTRSFIRDDYVLRGGSWSLQGGLWLGVRWVSGYNPNRIPWSKSSPDLKWAELQGLCKNVDRDAGQQMALLDWLREEVPLMGEVMGAPPLPQIATEVEYDDSPIDWDDAQRHTL